MYELEGRDLQRLRGESNVFRTKTHASYLIEAMVAVQRGLHTGAVDPGLDALALLVGMWQSGFVDRPAPKKAMNDVGRWLERRVATGTDPRRLVAELGWLRRLAVTNDKLLEHPPPDRSREQPRREFGQQLESLRQRGKKAREEQARAEARAKKQAELEAAKPTELPEAFEVAFADFAQAWTAYQALKKRKKKGKAPKEARLAVRPVNEDLVSLATGLVVSTTATEGFEEAFERVGAMGGGLRRFEVRGHQAEDGALVASALMVD